MAEDEVSAATDNNAERLTKWQFPEHNLNREVQSPVEGDECVIQEQVDEDAKKLDIPASWLADYKKSKRPPAVVEAAVHVDPSLAFSMGMMILPCRVNFSRPATSSTILLGCSFGQTRRRNGSIFDGQNQPGQQRV
jgi:hypothetical protein